MGASGLEKTIRDTREIFISEVEKPEVNIGHQSFIHYSFLRGSNIVCYIMKYILPVFVFVTLMNSNNVFGQRITVLENPKKLGDSINSKGEEIQPLLSRDGTLYFVRTFYEENLGGKTGGQDIWFSVQDDTDTWLNATNLLDLNNSDNNAVVGISENSNALYLLNSYSNPSRMNFGIWTSARKAKGWNKPKELTLSLDSESDLRSYFVCPQGDVILFTSQRENSFGMEDIYLYYLENDNWIGPVHLDERVNTAYDEISPFLTEDHKSLFFASKGHGGFGNFDIYVSERIGDSWSEWTPAKNVGDTINSPKFEGYFSTYNDGRSFYVSNQGSISTDIYTTKIGIATLGVKSDTLAYSELVRMRFKETLLMDTTVNNKIVDISNASLEAPHSLSNILKGNNTFNLRLFGVDERDSLVTQYINEQLATDVSSIEFERRKKWNRALTEDIRLLVNNNSKLANKISKVQIAEKPDSSLTKKDSLIFELKNNLGKLAVKNAALKQEISELMSQNSLSKHNYTQFHEDIATQSRLKSQIMANSEQIEKKIVEWQSNLVKIDEQGDELINIVSEYEVYLSSLAKNTLSDKPIMKLLDESLFDQQTITSNQVTKLNAENPELFGNIDKIMANNKQVSRSLTEIGKSESKLNSQVLSTHGLSRDSEEYNNFVQSISNLTNDISNKNQLTANISDESKLLAQNDSNELTKDLSLQIVEEMELEKNISDLILENALLKQKLVQEPENMDSTVMKINANETMIAEQLNDLQETMEVIEQNTFEVEKFLSPQLYVEHALIRSNIFFQKFNNLLDQENETSEGFLNLNVVQDKMGSEFIALTQLNQQLNNNASEVGQDYIDFNQKLTDELRESDDLYEDGIAFMKKHTQSLQSITNQIDSNNKFTDDFVAKAEKFGVPHANSYSNYLDSIVDLSMKNAKLKQEILSLTNENSDKRQKMLGLDVLEGSYVVDQIIENTIEINKKITALEGNMSLLEQYYEEIEKKCSLEARIRNINVQQKKLNESIEKVLSLDIEVLQILDHNPKLENLSGATRLLSGSGQLNTILKSMNDEYLAFGQNMLDKTNLDSSSDSLNFLISSSMVNNLESIDTVMQNMKPFAGFDKEEHLSEISKAALLKQEVALHINQNTAFKMFLDSTDLSVNGEEFVKMVEFNTESIHEKVAKWTDLLQSIVDEHKLKESSKTSSKISSNTVSKTSTRKNIDATEQKIEGYTVQVLAMPNGIDPMYPYLAKLNSDEIKITEGKDGLCRYYIGEYLSRKEANKAMKAIIAKGYADAFIRSLVEYSRL